MPSDVATTSSNIDDGSALGEQATTSSVATSSDAIDDTAKAAIEVVRDDVTPAVPASPDDVTAARVGRRSRLGLLREHDFRQLFLADTGSQFGTQIGWLALPLTAAVTLHATVFQMGLVTAADTLPFLLVSLPAGALVDRSRRRYVMIMCDILRALTLASVPVAWWLGTLTIWQVIVVAFVIGVLSAVFDVA